MAQGGCTSDEKIQVKFLMMTSRVLELFLQSAEKVCRDAWDSINETSDSIDMSVTWPLMGNPLRAHLAATPLGAPLSKYAIRAHLQGVRGLLSIVRHSLWGWDMKRMFVSGTNFFTPGSLLLPSKESAEPIDESSEGDKALSLSLMGARLQLVAEVTVKSSINQAIALSAELLCDRAVALTECMRMLLLTGRHCDRSARKLQDGLQKQVAATLVSVVCEQVVTVLSAMRKDRRYRPLLATVPADLFKSVKTSAKAARVSRAAKHF